MLIVNRYIGDFAPEFAVTMPVGAEIVRVKLLWTHHGEKAIVDALVDAAAGEKVQQYRFLATILGHSFPKNGKTYHLVGVDSLDRFGSVSPPYYIFRILD